MESCKGMVCWKLLILSHYMIKAVYEIICPGWAQIHEKFTETKLEGNMPKD